MKIIDMLMPNYERRLKCLGLHINRIHHPYPIKKAQS